MVAVPTSQMPGYLFDDAGALIIERAVIYFGMALKRRLPGKKIQQFPYNPSTNDDGERFVVSSGTFEAHDGRSYALTTLIAELPADYQSANYATDAEAAQEWADDTFTPEFLV